MKEALYNREFNLTFILTLFFINCYLLIINPWWVIFPFISLQALFFVGFFEAFHQAVHHRLVKNKKLNVVLGHIFGMVMGSNFYAYRGFHLKHHSKLNTKEDPERKLFNGENYSKNIIINILRAPILAYKNSTIFNQADIFLNEKERKLSGRTNLINNTFSLAILVMIYMHTEISFKVFIAPMFLFLYVEYFIGHSQHYYCNNGYKLSLSSNNLNNEETTDLLIPKWASYIMLHANLHTLHHSRPGVNWPKIWKENNKSISTGKINKPIKITIFLKDFIANGPKENSMK